MLRQVGESHKDYAARMYGWARAAQADRDAAIAEVQRLETELATYQATKTVGGPPPAPTPGWVSGPSTAATTADEEAG